MLERASAAGRVIPTRRHTLALLARATGGVAMALRWGTSPAAADGPDGLESADSAGSQNEPSAAPVPGNGPTDAATALSDLELEVLALVNGARAERNLPPLQWDAAMATAAREHAVDMMAHGVVSHIGSDGSTPLERLHRAGVDCQFGSENIWTYWGGVPSDGPSTMHAAMMAEPYAPGLWNHIGNILYAGYRRIGVGLAIAPNGVQYLCETFAD